ncbi:MAG TPA: hypothetical protein VFF36_07400, partial [Planctomycetota bacterium]|nr:hypothetical protein [Planctomycetota bacterium]
GEQWTLRGHRAEVPWVVFGDGGVLLSLSVDGTARVWHPGRRAARVLAGHQGAVDAVRFGPRLATVGQDATLRVWDPAAGTHIRLEHPAPVRYVEIGGRWAITSDAAHTCRLWDLGAGTARVLGGRAACTVAAAFDPEARRVALLARGGELTLWGTDGALLRTQPAVLGATWSGGHLFTVGRDGAVARDGAIVAHAREPRTALASGDRFVVREPGTLAILDLATLSWTRVAAPEAPFMTMALAASGRLVVGDARGRLHVVDGGAIRELVGHTRGVIAAALSVDGRWLASASQGELLLWDLERGGHRRLHGHAEWVNGLAFSPDGRQLASAGADGTLRLWPVETVASPEPTTAVLDDRDELVITPPVT